MPATEEISETLVRDNIVRAVADVFKTMLGQSVRPWAADGARAEPWPPAQPDEEAPLEHVVGTVGFIGDVNGLIYFYLDQVFAGQCTAALLGMSEREIAELGGEAVNDAVGELTNMVVGSFKNGLCDAGYDCKLTIPSILRGRNFCIEPISSTQRYVFPFESAGHRIVADILMKSGE